MSQHPHAGHGLVLRPQLQSITVNPESPNIPLSLAMEAFGGMGSLQQTSTGSTDLQTLPNRTLPNNTARNSTGGPPEHDGWDLQLHTDASLAALAIANQVPVYRTCSSCASSARLITCTPSARG